jgi:hypothetical protein
MKKNTITTLLLGIFASICLATQCEKEPDPEKLPPETREGKGTFGCYVNDVLFVKRANSLMQSRPLTARYSGETDILRVSCLGDDLSQIGFEINNPREGENRIIFLGYLIPLVDTGCRTFACENCGHVFITRFDTINKVVSGRFEFSGRCSANYPDYIPIEYTGDSIVRITEGRFDIGWGFFID